MGHGRRRRQAHDEHQTEVWVRRGICRLCHKAFTILPHWLVPSGHFTLRCRQQACERLAAGQSAEQAAPQCLDSSRLPDASTVLRWAERRLLSVACWLASGALGSLFLNAPTIIAWDLPALCRILLLEAESP